MTDRQATHKNVETGLEKDIRRHRGRYVFEGLLFLALAGLVALLPGVTALSLEIVLAALLVTGGVYRLYQAATQPRNRGWRLLSGVFYAGIGGAMLYWPAAGLVGMIWAIGLLLIIDGIFETSMALTIRPFKNWGWMLVAGIISLFLGIVILTSVPEAGIFFIAVAVGLSMAFYGSSVLALALRAG